MRFATDRNLDVLDAVEELIDRYGFPPTVREIGDLMGLSSPSTIQAHLEALTDAGLITRDPLKPRTLRVLRRAA